ncbi:zf-HC2 domain-containing protein [Halomonas ramblicola]|nr:zf-HC2 domain-containing protein [Halomonas ramblicola]MDN3521732.1 zf-HC2 domain-containing protein [Halomonas ramblicola]
MLKHSSCKEATRLMSKRLDTRLTWRESLSLRLHLAMCRACSRCQAQFRLLGEYRRRFKGDIPQGTRKDPDAFSDRS